MPTEEVIAFPFGEGVGIADGRGHCLPPLGKVSVLPTEEVIAFPFGEGVGSADGRGLYDNKCSYNVKKPTFLYKSRLIS